MSEPISRNADWPSAYRKKNGQTVAPTDELRPYARKDGGTATVRAWRIGPCLDCGATWATWASTLYDGLDDQGKLRRCTALEFARCPPCRAARRRVPPAHALCAKCRKPLRRAKRRRSAKPAKATRAAR